MTAEIEPFQAIALSRLAHQLKAEGAKIIHMEFGQPSTGAPAAAIAEAHRVLDSDPMGYWSSEALKARIARHYAEAYGVTVDPDRIVLTCGASPALVLALSSAFKPGDRVATARPGYVAYRNTLKALHLQPVEIGCGPAERFQMTAQILAELDPAPAGVIIASPANPTGTIIPERELEAIARVCRERGIRIGRDLPWPELRRAGGQPTALRAQGPDRQQLLQVLQHGRLAARMAGGAAGFEGRRPCADGQPLPHPALAQPARGPGRHGLHDGAPGPCRGLPRQSRPAA
jgi:aspartate/methionine/tyrosine aminotransferase